MAGEHEANFLKIVLLLMRYGSKVLQQRIEFELRIRKWQTVIDFLRERKHDILHLTLDKCKRCCIEDCKIQKATKCLIHYSLLELMYKDVKRSCSTRFYHCCSCNFVPKSDLDISVWDITLTSCLLLEVIGFDDLGQKQAIQNLRNLRNSKELLHRGNAKMDDDEYNKMWIRLSNDIKEVAEKCEPYFYSSISEEVDRLKNKSLEQGECYRAQECLKEVKNEDDSMKSVVKLWTTFNLSELNQDTEVENIYEYSKSCLKDHKERIGMYVGPKRAMKQSLKALENHRFIIITGEAGSGKTHFGLELMSQMQKKNQNLIALVLTDSSQWNKLDFKKEYILFFDDLLGKSNANDLAFHGWSMAFDSMHKKLLNNHVIIIFALRNCIWHLMKDRLADYTLFRLLHSSNPPVDLSGDFGMTSREKLEMLKRFCRCNNVIVCNTPHEEEMSFECSNNGPLCICQESLRIIANMDTSCGFPFLCEEFFSQKKFLKQGSSFFRAHSASSYFKGQVDELLSQEKYLHYAVLVFFFLKDDLMRMIGLEEILKSKAEIIKVVGVIGDISPKKITKVTIKSCLKDMLNIFIISSENGYRLRHMVIYEAVLLSFGENFSEEFLELISKTVLFTYVRSKGYVPKKQEIIVQLDVDMTASLAKKLIDVYESDKKKAYADEYKHPSFHDKKLVDCFLDILNGEESFKAFLNSFVAGACKERKDILAGEVIRRFCSSYEFEMENFNLVLNYDLIYTFRQCMNKSRFKKLFLKLLCRESFLKHILVQAAFSGACECFMLLLNFLDSENDLENDLETDGEKQIVTYVKEKKHDIIFHLPDILIMNHSPSFGNDWSDALARIANMYPCPKDRNRFYKNVINYSILIGKKDIVLKFFDKVDTYTSDEVCELMRLMFVQNYVDLFCLLCKKLKRVNFHILSFISGGLSIECVKYSGNEDMFNCFLSEIPCNFNKCTHLGSTILHACEAQNFSDSTLLRLLQGPDGKSMFTSVDGYKRTPVQCRASYKKIRRLDSIAFRSCRSPKRFWLSRSSTLNRQLWVNRKKDTQVSTVQHVHNVDWRDDTLVVYSSLKYAPILIGFSKLNFGPRCKDW